MTRYRVWAIAAVGLGLLFIPAFVAFEWKFTITPFMRDRIFFIYVPSCLAFVGSVVLSVFGRSPALSILLPAALSSFILAGYIYAIGHANPWMGILWLYVPWLLIVCTVGVGFGTLIRKMLIKQSSSET